MGKWELSYCRRSNHFLWGVYIDVKDVKLILFLVSRLTFFGLLCFGLVARLKDRLVWLNLHIKYRHLWLISWFRFGGLSLFGFVYCFGKQLRLRFEIRFNDWTLLDKLELIVVILLRGSRRLNVGKANRLQDRLRGSLMLKLIYVYID